MCIDMVLEFARVFNCYRFEVKVHLPYGHQAQLDVTCLCVLLQVRNSQQCSKMQLQEGLLAEKVGSVYRRAF